MSREIEKPEKEPIPPSEFLELYDKGWTFDCILSRLKASHPEWSKLDIKNQMLVVLYEHRGQVKHEHR